MMRIIANIVAAFSIIALPWWGVCIALIVFLVVFDFVEIMVFALALDIIYGVPGSIFSAHAFVIFAALLYCFSVWIRPFLKAV
jgi:predicted membrane protein